MSRRTMECLDERKLVRNRDFCLHLTDQRILNITEIVNCEHLLATIRIVDLREGWSSGLLKAAPDILYVFLREIGIIREKWIDLLSSRDVNFFLRRCLEVGLKVFGFWLIVLWRRLCWRRNVDVNPLILTRKYNLAGKHSPCNWSRFVWVTLFI